MAISNIFSHLVELTSNVTNAYTTALYSANRKEETFSLREHFSLNPNLTPKAKVPFAHSLINKAIKSKMPMVIDHFDAEADEMDIFNGIENLKSFLIVPVIHDEFEGVLVIATKDAYSFSPKLQKIVSGFAEQIAWHLFQERPSLGEDNKACPSIRTMNTYLRFLADSPDQAMVAKRLIEIPPAILVCDAVAVIWFNGNNLGKVQEHRGFQEDPSLYTVVQGAGIIGACAQSRTPIISTAFDNNLMTLFSDKEKTELFKSVAAVPIQQNNRLLGVLACASLTPDGLSQPELDTLSMIASGAATSPVFTEKKSTPANDKNRDAITGIYNHRFLIHRQQEISEKIFNGTLPVYFLSVQLTNLPTLYETHGIQLGDSLLRGMVSLFNKRIPSPKNIFKYSDNSFLIMILKRNREEVDSLESHLKDIFDNKPLSVNGTSLRVQTEWGLASYPDEGKNLIDLISLSWARTSQQLKVTI
jgi:diguanylate cyclase (GGDEF)-like protein